MHQLSPEINRNKWHIEECVRLFDLHKKYKNKWKSIADNFIGRTDNSIKNQLFSIVRKAMRKACKVLGNVSNTTAINKIKPKVLSNYLSTEYEIKSLSDSQKCIKVSLNDFVQKFAFNKYSDLATTLSDEDLFVVRKCVDVLTEMNENYMKKKKLSMKSKSSDSKDQKDDLDNEICDIDVQNYISNTDTVEVGDPILDPKPTINPARTIEADRLLVDPTLDLDKKLDNLRIIYDSIGTDGTKLILFLRNLGLISSTILNVLNNKEEHHLDDNKLDKLLNVAQSVQGLLETTSLAYLNQPISENLSIRLNSYVEIGSPTLAPEDKEAIKLEDAGENLKREKLDLDLISESKELIYQIPDAKNPSQFLVPMLDFNKLLNSIKISDNHKLRTTLQLKDNIKIENNPFNLHRLSEGGDTEPSLEKRSLKVFKVPNDFETIKHQTSLQNIVSLTLNNYELAIDKDAVFDIRLART